MTPEAQALRESMIAALSTAESLTRQVQQMERTCQHDWSEAVYDPDHKDAYTIPGDPPGTMGVDWRGPVHVPARTTKRWKRTCCRCGMVQATERTKMGLVSAAMLAKELPDFGD